MLDTHPFKDKVNVLILDDNESYLELLSSKLTEINSFEVNVLSATTIKEAFVHIDKHTINVCISDYYLQHESAIEFIDSIQNMGLDLPVIVITGDANDELTPLLLAHGAMDLIEKDDLSPALLARSIRYTIRRNEIDSQLNKLILENE
jgi:two-component system CheB/CheR fusion protein